MGGPGRALLIGLALVCALVAGLVVVAERTLDPASMKPWLIEAAQKATGRTLRMSGGMGIRLSLVPTIWMEDVSLSNPPGFSRPDMARVARVELSLKLFPLLRHRLEVEHIVLIRPDVLLEGDPNGPSNWVFVPERVETTTETPPAAEMTPAGREPPATEVAPAEQVSPGVLQGRPSQARFTTTLKDVSIEDGQVGWIASSGRQYLAGIKRLNFTEPAVRLTQLSGTVTYAGRTIELTARTGSPDELNSAFGAAPWPVTLQLRSGDASLTLDGKIAHPLEAKGYAFTVDADVPDPAAFDAAVPGLPLTSLGAVTAHAEISDTGGPTPALTALVVKAASVRLDKVWRGAKLTDATLSARGAAPLRVSGRLAMGGFEALAGGTIGDLDWLIHGRSAPVALDLAWNAAEAHGTVRGMIQTPRRLRDFALDVEADIPDPARVYAGAPPALKSVAFQARLTDTPGPMPFQFASNAGDVEGELSVTRSPRLSVSGTVSSRRLNLDMLRPSPEAAAAGAPSTGASSSGAPSAGAPSTGEPFPGGPSSQAPSSQTPSPGGPSPGGPSTGTVSPGPAATGPLFSGTKLPLERIRAMDADVKFALDRVRLGGTDIAAINAALVMKDGVLRLDPFAVEAPDQHLNAALLVDATETPPQVHLTVDSPGLALRPLLAAFGLPPVATGSVEVHANLTGTGDSPRALAASVEGRAGVAIEGGQLDAHLVNSWLETLRPLRIDGAGSTDLRCFAVRADAKSGVVTVQPGALNTAALIVEANGDIDLAREKLSLVVRPRTRIGGTGIALPLRVSGPLRAPSANIDMSGKGSGGGLLSGLLIGGKDIMGAAGGGDPCPAALSRAREGAASSGTTK
jgi:AsmA protein